MNLKVQRLVAGVRRYVKIHRGDLVRHSSGKVHSRSPHKIHILPKGRGASHGRWIERHTGE
ncbi:MAG: hypothetical protein ACOY3I_02540 [Verrucomicrobiota bacterium]